MLLREWDELPEYMKSKEVQEYHNVLKKKKTSLLIKRYFDVIGAFVLLIILCPIFLALAILIMADSPGGVFYRQVRITSYGRKFRIHKFRTMVADADRKGTHVTVENDCRITKIGGFLRRYRLDELPQLIDVLLGDMSFVGTRPEVVEYVKHYSREMMATLLLPAGITSKASIKYKDEAELLNGVDNPDKIYIEKILPEKMKYNLDAVKNFSCINDLEVMFSTVFSVIKK